MIASLLLAGCYATSAVPDDGIDDRAALQSDLYVHLCVVLGPGVYEISNDPRPGASYLASITVPAGRHLIGAGRSTILRFIGDGLGGDWWGIHVAGSGVTIEQLRIEFAGYNTEEQTHGIEIGKNPFGPVVGTTLRDLSFHWQRPAPGVRMGDCVRMLGEPGYEVRDTLIERVDFETCARTGVGVQRQVFGGIVRDSVFRDCGADVDFELTGGDAAIGGGFVFENNTHLVGPSAQGGYAFNLQSVSALLTDITIRRSRLIGRGIWAHNAVDVRVEDNEIRQTHPNLGGGALHFQKNSTLVTITGNLIDRQASAGPGPVISTSSHASGAPGVIVIDRNLIYQATDGNALYMQSADDVTIAENRIERTAGTIAIHAVDLSGLLHRTIRARVAGNAFLGGFRVAVNAVGGYQGLGVVVVTGNVTSGPQNGLVCSAGAAGIASVSSSGNVGPAPALCSLSATN